jgi:hypothetical protein
MLSTKHMEQSQMIYGVCVCCGVGACCSIAVSRYYIFQVFATFIFQFLIGTLMGNITMMIDILKSFAENPGQLVALLGVSAVQTSSFFMSFIMIRVSWLAPWEATCATTCGLLCMAGWPSRPFPIILHHSRSLLKLIVRICHQMAQCLVSHHR